MDTLRGLDAFSGEATLSKLFTPFHSKQRDLSNIENLAKQIQSIKTHIIVICFIYFSETFFASVEYISIILRNGGYAVLVFRAFSSSNMRYISQVLYRPDT